MWTLCFLLLLALPCADSATYDTSKVYTSKVYTKERFPNINFCRNRARGRGVDCCHRRDDNCSVPIFDHTGSSLCYCDTFCNQHPAADCCPDYADTCSTPNNVGECTEPGKKQKKGCNICECVYERWSMTRLRFIYKWQCDQDPCINDADLINNINYGYYGFSAASYKNFSDVKLKDGLKYYLGTLPSKYKVAKQHPINNSYTIHIPTYFDSQRKWFNLIHMAEDQGQCGASWAFSTAGVAADRLSIQSNGEFNTDLSVQQMLSCSNFVTSYEACNGGQLEDAWWRLRKQGLVSAECYRYTSGRSRQKGTCRHIVRCPGGQQPTTYKTMPAYRIESTERAIQVEIMTNGPVQSLITVKPDLFVYKSGIYGSIRVADVFPYKYHGDIEGTHSVKIIGWGVEGGVKYWLAVNSWGRWWGEDGMFKIKRGENESGVEEYIIGAWPQIQH